MNTSRLKQYIDNVWDKSIVPTLCDYIRIPNKSVNFDPQWAEHGHMDRAAELLRHWCEAHALPGMKIDLLRLPNRTPLLFIEVPGSIDDTVLMLSTAIPAVFFSGSRGRSATRPPIDAMRTVGSMMRRAVTRSPIA